MSSVSLGVALIQLVVQYHAPGMSFQIQIRGDRGRDRMEAGFTTTCEISAYHH